MMNEIWEDITGFEGRYAVSNWGSVKNIQTGKVLQPIKSGKDVFVNLRHSPTSGEKHCIKRLVAEAFCENPNGCQFVIHIDGDRKNNRAENLKWVKTTLTPEQHSNIAAKAREARRPAKKFEAMKGETVLRFNSPSEAKEQGFDVTAINRCCNRKRYSHKGYEWRYTEG